MSSADVMIFDMDLNTSQKKLRNGDCSVPMAPPPSPNSSTKRKFGNFSTLPMSRLIDCCEELVLKQSRNSSNTYRSHPLNMKRKTSDSDECCSSSSAGTSPGGSSDCCSFGKRSRSSLSIENNCLRKLNFSMSELSDAISAGESYGIPMES